MFFLKIYDINSKNICYKLIEDKFLLYRDLKRFKYWSPSLELRVRLIHGRWEYEAIYNTFFTTLTESLFAFNLHVRVK
jgi:hypothetical protein